MLGFSRKVTHLDGHVVTVTRSEVTQPGDKLKMPGEGMPRRQGKGVRQGSRRAGDLVVELKVKIPALSAELRSCIEELPDQELRTPVNHDHR